MAIERIKEIIWKQATWSNITDWPNIVCLFLLVISLEASTNATRKDCGDLWSMQYVLQGYSNMIMICAVKKKKKKKKFHLHGNCQHMARANMCNVHIWYMWFKMVMDSWTVVVSMCTFCSTVQCSSTQIHRNNWTKVTTNQNQLKKTIKQNNTYYEINTIWPNALKCWTLGPLHFTWTYVLFCCWGRDEVYVSILCYCFITSCVLILFVM